MDYYVSENKALILAAGCGTRLAPLTNKRPKCLVQVNGKSILFKQVENLLYNGITDITIVSGYKADILEKSVHELWPQIKIVKSTDYATTNNMYSAYLGIQSMFPDGKIFPFYMMNADVFFDESIIEKLEKDRRGNLICVDIGRYMVESMKVVEKGEKIIKISKQVSQDDALGCSIDVYKFNSEGGKAFFDCCTDYIENRKELNMWSEVALNEVLAKVNFYVNSIEGRWIEIDTYEDLTMAEALFDAERS